MGSVCCGCPNFEKSIRREEMGRVADGGRAVGLEGTFNWQILGACGGSVKRHSCSLGAGIDSAWSWYIFVWRAGVPQFVFGFL